MDPVRANEDDDSAEDVDTDNVLETAVCSGSNVFSLPEGDFLLEIGCEVTSALLFRLKVINTHGNLQ